MTDYRLAVVASVSKLGRFCNIYNMGFEKDSFFTMVKHSNPAKSLTLSAKILGSCNGLICLTSEKLTLMLFNPCTGNFNVIPDTVLKDYSGGCYGR